MGVKLLVEAYVGKLLVVLDGSFGLGVCGHMLVLAHHGFNVPCLVTNKVKFGL
jgi:hypothetical protein